MKGFVFGFLCLSLGMPLAASDLSIEARTEQSMFGVHRSQSNIERNRYRHPVGTLSFLGLKEGMTVRFPHAPTARASETAEGVRSGVLQALSRYGIHDVTVEDPYPHECFKNFRVWAGGREVDLRQHRRVCSRNIGVCVEGRSRRGVAARTTAVLRGELVHTVLEGCLNLCLARLTLGDERSSAQRHLAKCGHESIELLRLLLAWWHSLANLVAHPGRSLIDERVVNLPLLFAQRNLHVLVCHIREAFFAAGVVVDPLPELPCQILLFLWVQHRRPRCTQPF